MNEINTTNLLQYIPALKTINNQISHQELINWFNENDIDYFTKTDIEMYIIYIEKNAN